MTLSCNTARPRITSSLPQNIDANVFPRNGLASIEIFKQMVGQKSGKVAAVPVMHCLIDQTRVESHNSPNRGSALQEQPISSIRMGYACMPGMKEFSLQA